MLPTIKQIREANGGLSNLTDFEIAQHQHQQYQQYYPDFGEFAKDMGVDVGTKWGNRLSASVDNYQAGLSGVAEEVTGSTTMRNWREDNERLARNSQQFAASQGAIMSTKDVESISDVPELIGGWAVDSAPYLLESAVGGLAVRGLSTGLRGTMAAGRAADASVDAIRAAQAARKAMAVRTTAGGVLASYPSAVGDILQNQRDEAGETNLGSAALGGIGYAGLNALGLEGAAARGSLRRGINLLDEGLDGVKGLRGAALRTGVNAARVGTVEGLSETGQEMINQSFGRMAVNPDQTLFNPEANDRYQESFIAGFGLGGSMSAATGGWRRSEGYQAPIDENGGVNLLNGQPLNPPAPVVNPGANAPLADVINQRVGLDLNRQPTKGYESAFKAAQDEPSGVIAVDPATGQEYEMTQAQYLEREAAQRNDAFAQQLAAEQAALAEDKAKIEARNAVREEAKGLGVTGSKGADLYLELKQALEDGVISEADFRETRVQLGERKNNQVAKFIKAAYAQAETTQAAKAEREAGALAAVQNPTPQASTMSQEEADAMVAEWARLTGQQGDVTDVTDVQAREVQPTVGTPAVQRSRPPITQNTELRNWSTEPGAVAGLDPNKPTSIGRSGRKKDLTPPQVVEMIRKADPLEKMRILAVTGMDMVQDPTTGAPKLVVVGNPMTFEQVAAEEAEKTGRKVTRQGIAQSLAKFGIKESVATRVAAPDLPAVYSDADLEISPTEDGGAKEGSGFRIESAASKAAGQGVIYDEVSGDARLNKITDALLKGKITPETAAQLVADKTAAVQPARAGADTTTPVEMEQTAPTESKVESKTPVKTSEGKRVVKDLREDTTKIIAQRKRELLSHPEADNAAAMWDTARISWQDLPDALKADWIGMYVWNLDQNQRELDEGTLTRNQIEVERDFYDWQDYGGQQEQGGQPSLGWDAGAGGSGEVVDGAEAARPELPAPPAGPASEVVEADGAVQEVTAPRPYNVASLRGERGVLLEKFKAWAKNNPLRAPKADEVNATLNNIYARYKAQFPTENNQVAANAWAAEHGADIVAEWQTVIDTAMGVETAAPTETQEAATVEATLDAQEAAPAENTSAEDQRVAQENAAKAKVVVKKKRTIQKPVEAEVQAETAAEVVPTAPQILENLERLTSGTQPLVGEPTRTPSVSRQVRTLLSKLDSGEISAEAFANRLEMVVNAADRAKDSKPVTDRVRGADYFRQKLLEAKRRGDLSEEAVDLAEWFIQGNPALLDDVGISVRSSKNDGVSGFYDTMRRVVSLVKESGNAETTVHELLHHFERMMPAPVQDAIRKSWLNSLAKGIAAAKKSGNADLVAYYQHLSDLHLGGGGQSSLLAAQQLIRDGKVPYEHYANINASEFWAVNGSAIVAGRFKASQSVLGRLRNWLSELGQKIKAAFGLQSDAPIIRALDSLAKSDGKFVSGSMLAKADSYNNVTQSVAQQLGPQYAKAETALTRAIGDLKTAAIKYGAFTRDLIDQAAKLMPAARKYLEHYEAVATDRTRMEQQVDAVLERFAALNTHERARVNEVIRTSTMSKEWAFKPDWLPNAKYDENSDAARAFRALTPVQRGVIQDVFRHGHDTLEAMQKAVKDNVNSEFDVLIKGFRDAGNMDEATKAEARKAKALTEFSSMLEMNGNWPYAPLRRFGDHVVVAKSAAYRAAELADDKAQIKALEADENHYYVEFFESRGDARKAVDNMRATGKYDQVENFNKGNANEQLYGGRDVFNAFRRLRGLVNETGGASLSEPADATINKLMNDLYLSLLGERSARQAERNRKNTAGADRDMMRAFATKGRADAHFIASLRFGGQVQEDLLKMKKEADEGPNGGTRELRREYFNEILARHTMQMDFQSTPVVDKVMATSSLWQLLFNPAYYLQNVMQPWVMSLPMLAGKHGYGKSWSALARAYRDLGPLIKDGNFSKGDYDALPADVRAIVKDLAARGRIEITLEHDLGQWNSNVDDGRVTRTWTKVTKGLGKVNSRLEMLNRLATGIAAARLEGVGNAKNATDYADRVIIGTHGDYNAFNAPRLMRTPLGRMATQFRKFQLIQITMYTKLISDALKGASPDERAVARRVLAYNLGHMAALGGAMGLPGFQLFSMVLGSIFGDDDEPDDAEATLRRTLGNGPLTDALTRGVPNMLGVDLSGKVGSGNMLSLFPYADWDIESRSGYQNLLAAAAGPFVGGLMPKWADAVGTAKQGDYYKALEKVLPGAIGNAIKGTRFAVDGVTTTRGVQAMSADEITWVDGLFQAVGLPTSTIADRNFRSGAEYKASRFFDEKVSQVKKDYIEAFQDNDTDAMAEARQEWLDMQATRKRLGLTVQPLSQLIKAPRERMKRDRMAVGGVAADKETQGFVKNLME